MAATATVEYNGNKIKYDKTAVRSYKVQRALATPGQGMFDAVDRILLGKSEEVAETLGDDMQEMTALLTAIAELEADAKN